MAATTATARYREVLRVLVRYGFGFVVGGRFSFLRRQSDEAVAEALSRPSRLREAFEELGTTFIKLGQILSTRPDLLPPEYIVELQKLQDAVPAVPTTLIIARIEAELGKPMMNSSLRSIPCRSLRHRSRRSMPSRCPVGLTQS